MLTMFRPHTSALFLGDILSFGLALWLSLLFRAGEVPTQDVFSSHIIPFAPLFVLWAIVFFVAGLYESRSIVLARRALSATLLTAQSINVSITAIFFFFVPFFGIAPKTLLLVYLCVSFLLVLFWRVLLFPWLGLQKTEDAIVVGSGTEVDSLVETLSSAHHAPARIVQVIDASHDSLSVLVSSMIEQVHPRFVIADFSDTRVATAFPELYSFLLRGIRFIDSSVLYEEVFGRIPLSMVNERWLACNISRSAHLLYDPLKRALDIVCGFVFGIISLIFYPFVILAIKLDDGGHVFITQERVGEGGQLFNIHKFRSMSGNDGGRYGASGATKLVVTRVGKFLRRSRIDELPQLWNVVLGSLSLIGPRPEVPSLVALYEKEIPFYTVRHLIKPGLSGSAQLYYHADPHHTADVSSTKMKLSYDLFYIKHRSLTLDLSIGIKTIRRILMRSSA